MRSLVLVFVCTLVLAMPAEAVTDPASLHQAITSTRVEGDRAVSVENLKLGFGLAALESTESLLLLAIAARESDHMEDFESALAAAQERGADAAALSLSTEA